MTIMKKLYTLGYDAILEDIGRRLGRRRIAMQLTQAALAEQAGVQ
jgi:hypothetical protein